jgi:hypothetical protein
MTGIVCASDPAGTARLVAERFPGWVVLHDPEAGNYVIMRPAGPLLIITRVPAGAARDPPRSAGAHTGRGHDRARRGFVRFHGWQDATVGTATGYCGAAVRSHSIELYCQGGH